MQNLISFQDIIFTLQKFWSKQGCNILQPYDLEMGAATFHPATVLEGLSKKSLKSAYLQPSRRPTDSRTDSHPNRLERYYQFQVIMKPSPDNIQELYLQSLEILGISLQNNDILFSEDDWSSPSLGAAGLGWEILCNGSEISQFTYMQQIGAIHIKPVIIEITYGLERLAIQLQKKNAIKDIIWNYQDGKEIFYSEIHHLYQKQFSIYNTEFADVDFLTKEFIEIEKIVEKLIIANLPMPAYEYAIKASHIFNLLDARSVISVTEREVYIRKIRNLVKLSCKKWLELN